MSGHVQGVVTTVETIVYWEPLGRAFAELDSQNQAEFLIAASDHLERMTNGETQIAFIADTIREFKGKDRIDGNPKLWLIKKLEEMLS